MTDEFTTRLLVRAADLRDKFVDGRASAFKRDFPGWFAAFTEVLGFLTEAAARIRDSDRERDAALARVGELSAKWLTAMPQCFDGGVSRPRCEQRGIKQDGSVWYCDAHATRGSSDANWAYLVRAGTGETT